MDYSLWNLEFGVGISDIKTYICMTFYQWSILIQLTHIKLISNLTNSFRIAKKHEHVFWHRHDATVSHFFGLKIEKSRSQHFTWAIRYRVCHITNICYSRRRVGARSHIVTYRWAISLSVNVCGWSFRREIWYFMWGLSGGFRWNVWFRTGCRERGSYRKGVGLSSVVHAIRSGWDISSVSLNILDKCL